MTGPSIAPDEQNQWKTVNAIRQLAQGRSDASGIVTLAAAGAVSTVVNAPNCAAGSSVILMAASSTAGGTWPIWVSNVIAGQFTINHPTSSSTNNALTDRAFYYVTLG